jgi:hypothetical protein
MDEAAPQAARLAGVAARRGAVGHIMTAHSPEELGQMSGDDFRPGR